MFQRKSGNISSNWSLGNITNVIKKSALKIRLKEISRSGEMTSYFCFSDDSGNYKKDCNQKFFSACPYYIRSCVLIKSDEYNSIKDFIIFQKALYNIPLTMEIKFSDCWQLKKNRRSGRLSLIPHLDCDDLLNFIHDIITHIRNNTSTRLVFTITNNSKQFQYERKQIFEMHIQDLMQRVEMEIQNQPGNNAIFFIDNEKDHKDEELREAFFTIFQGDKFLNYNHLIESISISRSHQNIGIQLADYYAGILNNALQNRNPSSGYFKEVFPSIRRGPRTVMGYGVMEIPTDNSVRAGITNQIRLIIGSNP